MSNVNSVVVSGNAVADPEVKWESPEGDSAIVALRVAVNRSKKTDDGYEDVASFFDVVVKGKFAKLVDRKVRKGDALTVQGFLVQDRWQTEGGENRSKVVIEARDIDGAAFYRKADDVPAKESGGSTSSAPTPSTADDDDIPF